MQRRQEEAAEEVQGQPLDQVVVREQGLGKFIVHILRAGVFTGSKAAGYRAAEVGDQVMRRGNRAGMFIQNLCHKQYLIA